ncbi:hypothetical protein [Kineococcus rubinsiae]|uniref:hypothetical protein n=1 Tax=Kineococcus rubinsiae TaxID=2609562 RepID=UPI0014305F17|nr:hypothetical protein [Kineococcus rubinsiae]NIZ90397.1 hypothetical protein [Kineococcus rubinsiae]
MIVLLGAGTWIVAVLLGLTAAYRRSRDNEGRYLPFTVRRFDRYTGTVVTTKTWWALSLAAVAFTAAGAWLGMGRVAGGYGGLLSLLVIWVPDVLGTVAHNRRLTSSVDADLRQL